MLCVVRAYSLYSCGCCPWAIGKYRRRTKVLFLQCDFLYRFSHLHLTHPGSGTTFSGSRCPSLFLMRSCRHRQTLSARQLPDQPPVHFFFQNSKPSTMVSWCSLFEFMCLPLSKIVSAPDIAKYIPASLDALSLHRFGLPPLSL